MVIESGVGPFTARWAGLASLGTEGTEVGRGLKPPTGLRRSAKPTIAAGTLGAARSDESGGMAQAGDGLKAGGGGGGGRGEARGEGAKILWWVWNESSRVIESKNELEN